MTTRIQTPARALIDRVMLMELTTGPASCGRDFRLGDRVVRATGLWIGPPMWIHAEESVYDPLCGVHVEADGFEPGRCPPGTPQA